MKISRLVFKSNSRAVGSRLEPADLCLPAMKELGAKWLVKSVQHIADNPSFIVNEAGICQALDVDNKALGVEDSEIEEVDVNSD